MFPRFIYNDRFFVGRRLSGCNDRKIKIKALTKTDGNKRISINESGLCKASFPCIRVIGCESSMPSALEGKSALHERRWYILSRNVGDRVLHCCNQRLVASHCRLVVSPTW
jgi:hypothetical protein